MEISVSEAKGKLTELVHRAEQGDEIVLTRHGSAKVKLVALKSIPTRESRRKALQALMEAIGNKSFPGPSAARSQDFLYDDHGLP